MFLTTSVTVWGDMACFTVPTSKVERYSYPVLTPSAAIGILASIFGKPQFRWEPLCIEVHKPIRYIEFMHNEQRDKSSKPTNLEGNHIQRKVIALKDVCYTITATVNRNEDAKHNNIGFMAQFERRLKEGGCYRQPVLGMRDFTAFFEVPKPDRQTIPESMDLGPIPMTVDFQPDGSIKSKFYPLHMENGIIDLREANDALR